MHLTRSYFRVSFILLQIVIHAFSDDVNPDAKIFSDEENQISEFPSPLASVFRLQRDNLNIESPGSENTTSKSNIVPLNVTPKKIETISNYMNSTTEKKTSVKKELKLTPEINGTIPEFSGAIISVVQNATIETSKINATDKSTANEPSEIHNITASHEEIHNSTSSTEEKPSTKPGAKKRGLIVFGSLGLLSVSYIVYKLYRRRKQRNENDNSFFQNDNQHFKYGVLLSNENDDNLELSNLPLTVDSEDEEMEIFDIEQKKFIDNNRKDEYGLKSNLLAKDDIEILDLELPGSSDALSLGTTFDDNLLNLGDSSEVTVIQKNSNSGSKPNTSNDFFDIL